MSQVNSFGRRGSLMGHGSAKSDAINPANSRNQKMRGEREVRTRIPMSVPRAKLSSPEIAGFHTHWVNDYAGRVLQAIAAGYQFVSPEEALISSPDLAGGVLGTGSDLGTRVSVVVGQAENGEPLRAFLMKIPNEFFEEDQKASQDRVDDIHYAMEQGKQDVDGERADDRRQRYVKSVNVKSTYSRRG